MANEAHEPAREVVQLERIGDRVEPVHKPCHGLLQDRGHHRGDQHGVRAARQGKATMDDEHDERQQADEDEDREAEAEHWDQRACRRGKV